MIIYLFELGLAVVRLGIRLFFLLVYYLFEKKKINALIKIIFAMNQGLIRLHYHYIESRHVFGSPR